MKMHPSSVVVDSYQDVVHGQEDNAFISFFFSSSSFLSFGIGCTRSYFCKGFDMFSNLILVFSLDKRE